MKNHQQYMEWLESLKVGDTVCHKSDWHGYVIETIEKITPTKQIKTKHYTYKDGRCRIDTWCSLELEPVTKEVRDSIRAKEIRGVLRSYTFDKLNLDELEKVYRAIVDIDLARSAIVSTELPSEASAEGAK